MPPGSSGFDDLLIGEIVGAYLDQRTCAAETFLETYRRTGIARFKAALYEQEDRADAA